MYSVFFALREYVHASDSGVVDRANLYRLLYDVETLFSGMTTEVVALTTPGIIDPPFDFGNNFLLKVKSNFGDGFNTPLYVVVSSEANEDTLRTFTTAEAYTNTSSLPAVVASYKNYVESTSFFAFSDILSNLTGLNSGNSKQGTIYLNY